MYLLSSFKSRPPSRSILCTFFFLFFTPTQTYTAHVFMVLLSIHEDIQLGKYNVYNTLCLQLTFLINCNRNTAISSLIAGRIELYISSLSRIQKLWLPNFQWWWGEEWGSFYDRLWMEGKNPLKTDTLKAAFLKRFYGTESVSASLLLFAELLFFQTSQEVFVISSAVKPTDFPF